MYYERRAALKALEYISNDDMLIFTGARQTGKTTILKHLFKLLKNKDNTVLFINLEDSDYLKLLNDSPKNLLNLIDPFNANKTAYVFIDEIQYLDNPTNFLKFLYDEYRGRIKVIVSGSSAFYIDRRFKDSLAGRKKIYYVYPLSFAEFLLFKGRGDLQSKYEKRVTIDNFSINNFLLPEKREINHFLDEYTRFGGYPGVVLEESYQNKIERIGEIANSYIKKDILESRINYTDKYYELFRIFSGQTGCLVNKHELSNILNLSVTAIDNYLYLMQKSFHVNFIKPFYRNIRKELTKMRKVYFLDQGLRNYFFKNFENYELRQDRGGIFENFIYRELLEKAGADNIRFWRTQTKNEVDFIVDEKYAFEVKYNINSFSYKKYKLFLAEYPNIKFSVVYHAGGIDSIYRDISCLEF